MTKPTMIYIVTAGSYSDYRMHGVFSTKEKAQKYIDAAVAAKSRENTEGDEYVYVADCYWASDASIEEWPLDAGLKEKLHSKWSFGLFLDTGDAEYPKGVSESLAFGIPENSFYVAENVPAHEGRSVVRVESIESAAHAKKFAAEKRQEWLRSKR